MRATTKTEIIAEIELIKSEAAKLVKLSEQFHKNRTAKKQRWFWSAKNRKV